MPACYVKGCHNSDRKKKEGVTFHNFSKALQVEWLSAIGRDPNLLIIHQKVCSEHFNIDDFEQSGKIRRLKNNVIPTKNLPQQSSVGKIIIADSRTSSGECKQPTLFLNSLASTSNSMRIEGKVELGPMKIFSNEFKKFSVSEQTYNTSCIINNVPVETMPSNPLLIMISNSSNTEVKLDPANIILDFHDSKENMETNLNGKEGSDPRCPATKVKNECIIGLSPPVQSSSSFNPDHYLVRIKKAQQRGDYFMQKYQNTLKTSIRRKRKILILKQVLSNLRKKHRTLK